MSTNIKDSKEMRLAIQYWGLWDITVPEYDGRIEPIRWLGINSPVMRLDSSKSDHYRFMENVLLGGALMGVPAMVQAMLDHDFVAEINNMIRNSIGHTDAYLCDLVKALGSEAETRDFTPIWKEVTSSHLQSLLGNPTGLPLSSTVTEAIGYRIGMFRYWSMSEGWLEYDEK